ncbi:hypothetical protein SAMN05421504_106198 [Amycolatopsis xylanica]|uniref:Secreted protein n=1 Tax=Amycolatopsis xylanica TaxID=589385 RepID=A0A1H3LHJ6_9PSEU|nr:hypothetical protein [Amycolatopsis xylanica]SDY63325.1 hypothetical protein SAMN05421504_106198 [Amycolatopsis xylanica]
MKKTLARSIAACALTGVALLGAGAPAFADGPTVVDEPDTSQLNNIWTFAPLGVPVLGLIQALQNVPGRLLPS